jgi:GAF domain-containing protein
LSAKKLRVLPLIVGEQVLGVVTLHSDDHYLDNDLDLVKTIVQQAAIAILRFLSMQAGKIY